MIKIARLLIVIIFTIGVSGCTGNPPANYAGRIMVLSVSSDGKYVISTDFSQHVVLWNIPKRTYKIIASSANIYSAYFIKHTDDFIYQSNRSNNVYVMDVNGHVIKKIKPDFASYGELMTSNLKTYFASDVNFNIYKISDGIKSTINVSYCKQDHNGKPYSGKATAACTFFVSAGKLLNLNLSNDDAYLVGSGFGRLYIWNVQTGLGKIYEKNNAQTYATISPHGKYVLSGDSGMAFVKCTVADSKCHHFSILAPQYNDNTPVKYKKNPSGIVSIKFITSDQYLVFYNGIPESFPFAALYDINTPFVYHKEEDYYTQKPIKYLPLLVPGKQNQQYPATQDFDRDQAIDTSPSAHILVMAQAQNNGILVYKYNPKTQTLKQIWAPVIR